jgi:hypothetical protein
VSGFWVAQARPDLLDIGARDLGIGGSASAAVVVLRITTPTARAISRHFVWNTLSTHGKPLCSATMTGHDLSGCLSRS